MSKINDSAFPHRSIIENYGLTKLEYTAIKIFCALQRHYDIPSESMDENFNDMRFHAIEQAKLLLQECEEKK